MIKYKLNNNLEIPCIGFGTSLIKGKDCIHNTKQAIKCGYTLIDTASAYNNEEFVGQGIKESNIQRDNLFITSKVWKDSMGYENTIRSFNDSLKKLDVEYIDLFLIHWPSNKNEKLNIETWKALEDLYKEGKVKAIGVSNFLKNHLVKLMENVNIMPMVNQLEYHPGLVRKEALEFCKKNNILVEAWAPLGKGSMLKNEKLINIAKKYEKEVAQICLRWCVQNRIIPLPKSSNIERMKQNLDIFDFEISGEDMEEINNMEYFAGSNMDPMTFNEF